MKNFVSTIFKTVATLEIVHFLLWSICRKESKSQTFSNSVTIRCKIARVSRLLCHYYYQYHTHTPDSSVSLQLLPTVLFWVQTKAAMNDIATIVLKLGALSIHSDGCNDLLHSSLALTMLTRQSCIAWAVSAQDVAGHDCHHPPHIQLHLSSYNKTLR